MKFGQLIEYNMRNIFLENSYAKCEGVWLCICCKTKLKKNFFFWKNISFLQNIHCLQKKCFYMEKKKFYIENFFHWKKLFFTEKNVNKNVKIYISFEKHIFMQKMFGLQIKDKSFLNIYEKNFHKKYIC